MLKKIYMYMKNEIVLSAAVLLAIISAIIIKPDKEYISYIDYRTIALLFCLMTIMQGFMSTGVFELLAKRLLSRVVTFRQLFVVLVMLCFVCSMWITNDVSLITFIPFTILVLKLARLEDEMIPVIVMQTVAANLGSMCTPIGNPQNLYLYSVSGMCVMDFIKVMGPLSVFSLLMILLLCLFHKNYRIDIKVSLDEKEVSTDKESYIIKQQRKNIRENTVLVILFALSILTVARVIPYQVLLGIILIACILFHIIFDEKILFLSVDYSLLLTFVAFFVFIGNMGRIDIVKNVIYNVINGREIIAAFLCSQIISNVPAAILLSGFTTKYQSLMIGVNIGGLGTLIASLASLIAYKFYAQEIKCWEKSDNSNKNNNKNSIGKYMAYFTIVNIGIAVALLTASLLLL